MAEPRPQRGWFVFGFRGFAEPRGGGARRLEPEPGGIRVVRPAWSYTGLVTGHGRLVLGGWLAGALPGHCQDLLPSESHVLLLRGTALEAWARGARLCQGPSWQQQLHPGEAARPLPLAPCGYMIPRPPFLCPLPPALRAQKLVLGLEHVVLLGQDGTIYTWGCGRHGQLGHGGLEPALEPRLVEALHGVPMGDVAAGGWHSVSVSEGGDLYVWGWNESGQLALPSKALAEKRAPATASVSQHEEPCPGEAELKLVNHEAALGAEAADFISIQAFPALLDLPEGSEVSKGLGSSTPGAGANTANLATMTQPALTSHARLAISLQMDSQWRMWSVAHGTLMSVLWRNESS
ncbi:RCC1 domain-containing protein 1 isoform X2 [Gopherus evgoodei]|uniref:RCC1 domain-containing protein 1 isoform X2 n=1 Tax=Gopherus evgoodei TaxID=1825980 RepID=UPI0011CF07F2|nr:RCC1 domain-containing protein 1 isoform X2 [Gopherus evgoodei]